MSSSAEVFAQLSKWKSGSAKLYMSWAISGVLGWCIGVLKHVASSELHFGIDTIDRKDFLFVINVHSTYQPQFRFVDNREAWQFFAPQRERSEFGKTLEIMLRGSGADEYGGKVILAEVFPKQAIEI